MTTQSKDDLAAVTPLDRARETFAGSATAQRLDEVRQRVSETAEEAQERLETMTEDLKERAGKATDAARERLGTTTDTVRRGYTKARGDLSGALDDLAAWVSDNPVPAVGIAAGIGFAIGLFMNSRSEEYDDD